MDNVTETNIPSIGPSPSNWTTAARVRRPERQMSGWADLPMMKKYAMQPGEWKCEKCLVKNPATATLKCVSCEAPKSGASTSAAASSAGGGGCGGSIGAGGFSFGAPAPAPVASIGANGFSFGAPAPAPSSAMDTGDTNRKRVRADGQISKEEYNAVSSVDSRPGNFARANSSTLARRKIVSGKRDKQKEFSRHLTALNKNFSKYIDNLMRENPGSPWDAAIQDYLGYVNELERRYLTTSRKGQVFTFGSGECGQLAHGVDHDRDLMVKCPRLVDALRKKQISTIACGGLHNAAVTTSGQVYTWGCNDDGSLGRGGDENMPALVEGISADDVIIQVVAGDVHTAALSLSGEVFSWGAYRDGDGKLWFHAAESSKCYKHKQSSAIVVDGLPEVIEIKCGAGFTAARCSDGSVYTWGINQRGELARKTCEVKDVPSGRVDIAGVFREHLTPACPTLSDGSQLMNAKTLGCGSYHFMVFAFGNMGSSSSSGKLYTAGLNNYGQLGLGDHEDRWGPKAGLWHVSKMDGKQLVQIEGGVHHSLALTVDGEVYAWGRGDSGQLGTDDECKTGFCEESPVPVSIASPAPHVTSISCGANHCLVLTKDSDVYTWGYGEMYSLGHGKDRDENRPKKVEWRHDMQITSNARIVQVGGGGQHSALIIEDLKN